MAPDPGLQRLDVADDHGGQFVARCAGLDHPRQLRAGLGEHRHILAALVDLDLIDPRPGGGGGREDPEDLQLFGLLLSPLGLVLPGQAGGRLDGRDHDAEDIDRPPQVAPISRQPALLQAAQRHAGGGVTGQHHDVAALGEQPFTAGPGQIDDLLAAPPAIGRTRLVGQVDEVGAREPLHEPVMHGEPAHPGVEHADGHGGGVSGRRRGCHDPALAMPRDGADRPA